MSGVRERMLEAVRLRLRADVPSGIYLSGGGYCTTALPRLVLILACAVAGIDSSAIAGMVMHLATEQGQKMGSRDSTNPFCCFSIAFEESSGFDESGVYPCGAGNVDTR